MRYASREAKRQVQVHSSLKDSLRFHKCRISPLNSKATSLKFVSTASQIEIGSKARRCRAFDKKGVDQSVVSLFPLREGGRCSTALSDIDKQISPRVYAALSDQASKQGLGLILIIRFPSSPISAEPALGGVAKLSSMDLILSTTFQDFRNFL